MRTWGALLAAGALLATSAGDPEREAFEGWRFNPRERTSAAIEAFQQGRPQEAAVYAAAAHRLAPGEPLTAFNAGTTQLAARQPERAREFLEEAIRQLYGEPPGGADGSPTEPAWRDLASLPPAARELVPDLQYNLGNARLDAGDPAGAVAAYEQVLRLLPDHQDAKFNLELALAELARRNASSTADPSSEARGDQEGGGESSGGGEQGSEERQSEPSQDRDEEGAGGETSPPAGGAPLPGSFDSQLQQFEDQPDMSSSEAAAILEAVENLERQQRREAARERARQRVRGGKDW